MDVALIGVFYWRCRFFLMFFVPYIAVFALYGEYVVRFPLPDGVFLPSDYGLEF